MANETYINNSIRAGIDSTEINRDIASDGTQINTELVDASHIAKGTVLCNAYTVRSKLDTQTGEADLFLCENKGKSYIAKVYRRKNAIKKEILDKLIRLDSPYIAKVFATGNLDGYPVEILPYYKNGSIQHRRFSYAELKKHIIPCLNEGLFILHSEGIIHKDLKPANIMLNDNMKDVSIIDFGISSVRDPNNTVIVTKTGMTPEYSAPETFRSLFLAESDYYSLGITIYELFCGKTPYKGMAKEEIEKYVAIQNIPYPAEMPDDLKNLITALTYHDITNRRNKSNPNRRWGYGEVKRWCNGERLTIPGEGVGNSKTGLFQYSFLGNTYSDRHSLARALALNWDEGKRQLYRGILSDYFKSIDPELAGICMDAEEAVEKGCDEDVAFFRFIYTFDKSYRGFIWRGKEYKSLVEFGKETLNSLWNNENIDAFLCGILENSLLSEYCVSIHAKDNVKHTIVKLEKTFAKMKDSLRGRMRAYYLAAFILSGTRTFRYKNTDFLSIEDLTGYMNSLLIDSYAEFQDMCYDLVGRDGLLDVQFESWLFCLGKNKEINEWKSGLPS